MILSNTLKVDIFHIMLLWLEWCALSYVISWKKSLQQPGEKFIKLKHFLFLFWSYIKNIQKIYNLWACLHFTQWSVRSLGGALEINSTGKLIFKWWTMLLQPDEQIRENIYILNWNQQKLVTNNLYMCVWMYEVGC